MKDTDPCLLIKDLLLYLPRIPDGDPGVKNQIYQENGFLKISFGPDPMPKVFETITPGESYE